MSKKIVWAKLALREAQQTLLFWDEHNGSTIYSERLRGLILATTSFISTYPDAGVRSNIEHVRFRILDGQFLVLYRILNHHIRIMRFWDTRQNPNKLKRYLK